MRAGPRLTRRGLATTALLALTSRARADDAQPVFFRIATGSVSGTYYPVGGLIATIVSRPPGAPPCAPDGPCGVEGLVAVVQSSDGSVSNVASIQSGAVESGFAQSDVAYWAYRGEGAFAGKPPMTKLRVLGSLYPESVHLVVRPDAGIAHITDLKHKRVSLDRPGSGTRVDAELVLAAAGLGAADLDVLDTPPGRNVDLMKAGDLDAFFLVAGYPVAAITELATDIGARLVPIDGPELQALRDRQPFFGSAVIPAGTYPGVGATATAAVQAQWLVSADEPDALVTAICGSLWRQGAEKVLDAGHPKGREIRLASAIEGIAVPLHPGAEAFYRERGLLR
ncbi:MAG: TAXI family TRAP transporter solute-binding subunit [Geminicoccaceae bacterium]